MCDCSTCAKLISRNGKSWCAVLKEMTPEGVECFAYTSDPDWREKVRRDVRQYARKKAGYKYVPTRYEVLQCMKHDGYKRVKGGALRQFWWG